MTARSLRYVIICLLGGLLVMGIAARAQETSSEKSPNEVPISLEEEEIAAPVPYSQLEIDLMLEKLRTESLVGQQISEDRISGLNDRMEDTKNYIDRLLIIFGVSAALILFLMMNNMRLKQTNAIQRISRLLRDADALLKEVKQEINRPEMDYVRLGQNLRNIMRRLREGSPLALPPNLLQQVRTAANNPNLPVLYHLIAKALLAEQTEDWDAARAHLEHLHDMDHSEPDVLLHLSHVHNRLAQSAKGVRGKIAKEHLHLSYEYYTNYAMMMHAPSGAVAQFSRDQLSLPDDWAAEAIAPEQQSALETQQAKPQALPGSAQPSSPARENILTQPSSPAPATKKIPKGASAKRRTTIDDLITINSDVAQSSNAAQSDNVVQSGDAAASDNTPQPRAAVQPSHTTGSDHVAAPPSSPPVASPPPTSGVSTEQPPPAANGAVANEASSEAIGAKGPKILKMKESLEKRFSTIKQIASTQLSNRRLPKSQLAKMTPAERVDYEMKFAGSLVSQAKEAQRTRDRGALLAKAVACYENVQAIKTSVDLYYQWGLTILLQAFNEESDRRKMYLTSAADKFKAGNLVQENAFNFYLASLYAVANDEFNTRHWLKVCKQHGNIDANAIRHAPDFDSFRDKAWFQEYLVDL